MQSPRSLPLTIARPAQADETPRRRELGMEGLIHLDEATTSWPKAPGVVDAVTSALVLPPPLPGAGDSLGVEVTRECQERLARLLGVPDADRVMLTAGAAQAVNLAVFGLGRHGGALVIASCAEQEPVLRPLCYLRERKRIRLRIVGLDAKGEIDGDAYACALARGTALVVLTHASNVTGRVFDVAPLFAMAKSVGAVTLLDASHSLGEVSVRPDELGADMVAFAGHKRLRGPSGTGGLYAAPHVPLWPSPAASPLTWTGLPSRLPDIPVGFDRDSPNLPAFAGLCAALCWHEAEGAACRQRGEQLFRMLRRGLKRMRSVSIVGDRRRAPRVPIVSFVLAGHSPQEVKRQLETRFGVRCAAGLHSAPLIHKAIGTRPEGTVRLSVSGFNTEQEIRLALSAIRRVAAGE